MKLLLPLALPFAMTYLCSAYAAYISVHDPTKPWTGFQEELLLTPPPLDDGLDNTHYLCDIVIGNSEALQVSVHSTSLDDWTWTAVPTDAERNLSQEYIAAINQHLRRNFSPSNPSPSASNRSPVPVGHSSSSITCQRTSSTRPTSFLQQRIGFMHVLDLLSILGVGFFAAAASGVAACFRRQDHHMKISDYSHRSRLDGFHERPTLYNVEDTEYVFNYIKSKLG